MLHRSMLSAKVPSARSKTREISPQLVSAARSVKQRVGKQVE